MSNWRMLLAELGMNYWWYGKCAWILDAGYPGYVLTDDVSIPGVNILVWPPLVSGWDEYFHEFIPRGTGNFPYGYTVSPDR